MRRLNFFLWCTKNIVFKFFCFFFVICSKNIISKITCFFLIICSKNIIFEFICFFLVIWAKNIFFFFFFFFFYNFSRGRNIRGGFDWILFCCIFILSFIILVIKIIGLFWGRSWLFLIRWWGFFDIIDSKRRTDIIWRWVLWWNIYCIIISAKYRV